MQLWDISQDLTDSTAEQWLNVSQWSFTYEVVTLGID